MSLSRLPPARHTRPMPPDTVGCPSVRDAAVVSSPPMRRLLRWLVNGLCLLSLLACVGAGCLWWHGSRVEGDWFRASVRGAAVGVYSHRSSLELTAIGKWPGPARLRGRSIPRGGIDREVWLCLTVPGDRGWGANGGMTQSKRATSSPPWTPAGCRRRPSPSPPWTRRATPRRCPTARWSAPHWQFVIVTSLPPLLRLALPARRLCLRRRRRRLGRCLRCGYDLRGTASGRCSECGEAAQQEVRVTP